MNVKFRPLTASEIECRVAQVKQTGLQLLLYKDARCDMNILDETVGALNWKREHTRENANCIVSLWDSEKGQWVSKEDTGTESNTEKEKGLASDSFKRACFNWGIGRELYTSPFIWIPAGLYEVDGSRVKDRFNVNRIEIQNGIITDLEIVNSKGKTVYSMGKRISAPKVEKKEEPLPFTDDYYECEECGSMIADTTTKSGKIVSAAQIAKKTMAKYNMVLCTNCAKGRAEQ